MSIKFTFLLRALDIKQKGKLKKKKKKKEGRENWIKSPSNTSYDQFHLKKV